MITRKRKPKKVITTATHPGYISPMKQNHIALLIALTALTLSACGNKGALVSAQKPVPVEEALPPIKSPPPTDPADPAPAEDIAPPADEEPATATPL